MKIIIVLISECKDKQLKNLISEQVKRISKFSQIQFLEVSSKESLKNLKDKYKQYYLIALAEKGKEYSSKQLAEKVENLTNHTASNLLFVVSDADGFRKEDFENADEVLSLSKMTFPHELTVLLLAEQIFRTLSILNNHPYHRE